MCEIRLKRHPEVYEPAEDTVLLADNLDVREEDNVLEVGVGSGYVSLIAAKKARSVVGIDVNPQAVRLAKTNAKLNGIRNVDFIVGDLFSPVSGRFDIVIMNPPYLPEEKVQADYLERAWNGGSDGRQVTDRFIDEVHHYLKKGGRVEIVQSSLSGCDETVRRLCESGFKTRMVAERKFFFERIVLIEAMKPDECSRS
jgi:release factor glutamine methyltransferase